MEALTTALDPRDADGRIDFAMARAEVAQRTVARAYAEQLAAIDATLREARENPEVFVVTGGRREDDIEFAERAAVADLAVRLAMAEQTVRAQAFEAATLIQAAPRIWQALQEGEASVANARTVAATIATLAPEAWVEFEAALLPCAATSAPARFRARARLLGERLQPQLASRHDRAASERRVWLEPAADGMCWLNAYLPAHSARRAMSQLDAAATSLAEAPDETRTVGQLRADALVDLIAGVLGEPGSVGVSVIVTVPMLSLLGGDAPADLDGLSPMDAETARRLAAHAPSFMRLLTHPVSTARLDLDRTTYRVPADLRRWLELRDGGCRFPGCGRVSRGCDIDHTTAWEHGGTTSANNLAHLCRHHHRLKHMTRWSVEQGDQGIRWTSPTGESRTTYGSNTDPPPF